MNCKYDCDCCKNRVIIYDDRGPQGPTAGIYRQPNTNYVQKECAYLEGEPLNIFLECQTPGTTSPEDLLTLPEGKNIDDTFNDGEVTWIIRKLITSSYDGDLKLNGNITANNATIKNKTTTQTLEVLGDGQVNGNFNINRKLTVNEIDCKTNLTIGGQKPLDASALQKIQDQIIAPSQSIVVSADYGNDETGDGSDAKPYKTLDRAVRAIKPNIQSVYIWLVNNKPDLEYSCSCIGLGDRQFVQISVTDGNNLIIKGYRAKITVRYSVFTYGQVIKDGVFVNRYHCGTPFLVSAKAVRLIGLNINVEDGYDDNSKFGHSLLLSINNLSMGQCSVIAQRNLLFNQSNDTTLNINDNSYINIGNNYLLTGTYPTTCLDNIVQNPNAQILPEENNGVLLVALSALLVATTGTHKGINPQTAVALYKNF